MRRALAEKIRRVEPYVPGEQPKGVVIKLNTNENPYPPAPGVKKALQELDADQFRLYPDPTAELLVSELSAFYGIEKEKIFVGVGSDDVLSMCFLTFFHSDLPILFPDITYSFYKVWAELYRIPYHCPKLDEQFRMVKEEYQIPNGGIIFPNPNAPTAIYEELDFIEDILRQNRDSVVIVDEAYIDFAGRSAIELIDQYENLLVVQTCSKSRSMAGMRIGFAMGNPELIRCLLDAKYSFNSYTMNQTSLVCGAESIRDEAYFRVCIDKIVETREWAKEELTKMGFQFPDSRANFLFVTHPRLDAKELFEALRQENIYVRYWDAPRIDQYLRITVGTREEMQVLLEFLKNYIGKKER